ncbi:hypothetical protein [Tatumella sp. UBA2305]|uniref:hypothetical protein n=1 Tax=Tatumella sp. UBA2305 TaxID=1947647 RepID=UPI0025D3F5E7|nr:hypothetical protein [Tatumella sp. UBA2305]
MVAENGAKGAGVLRLTQAKSATIPGQARPASTAGACGDYLSHCLTISGIMAARR